MGATLQDKIWEDLLRKILSGELKAGQKLPPEQELKTVYGASLSPIRHALTRLADEGFVSRRSGKGTFVRAATANPLRTRLSPFSFYYEQYLDEINVATISVAKEIPPAEVARELAASEKTELVTALRVRTISGKPVILFKCWYAERFPEEEIRKSEDFFRTVDFVNETFDTRCSEAKEVVDVAFPDPTERKHLQLLAGHAVLRVKRVMYNWDGEAIFFNRYLVNTEIWQYRVSFSL